MEGMGMMDMYSLLMGGSGGGGGGDSSVVVVNETAEETLDKTWQEIFDAIDSGKAVFVKASLIGGGGLLFYPVVQVSGEEGSYLVKTLYEWGEYVADSADGYPAAT